MPRRLTQASRPSTQDEKSGVPLADGWALVIASWQDDALIAEQTGARLAEIGARFTSRLERAGIATWSDVTDRDCRSFIEASTRSGGPPSVATQHLRRSTVRAVFRTLRAHGVIANDPTLDLRLPPRQQRPYRPLTDDEVILCRAASRLGDAGMTSLRRAVAWALGEATAATSEIGAVRLEHLDNARNPHRVWLSASKRYAEREAELSEWGSQVIARRSAALLAQGATAGALLAYAGSGPPGQYLAQASVCTQMTNVLEVAGVRDDPSVRARSLRGWAGESLYRRGVPLEAVAVRLGCSSLDAAAAVIGLQWRP